MAKDKMQYAYFLWARLKIMQMQFDDRAEAFAADVEQAKKIGDEKQRTMLFARLDNELTGYVIQLHSFLKAAKKQYRSLRIVCPQKHQCAETLFNNQLTNVNDPFKRVRDRCAHPSAFHFSSPGYREIYSLMKKMTDEAVDGLGRFIVDEVGAKRAIKNVKSELWKAFKDFKIPTTNQLHLNELNREAAEA